MKQGRKKIEIDRDNDGVRVDRFLRKRLNSLPLATIYALIRKGHIRVNNRCIKQNYRLTIGDCLELSENLCDIEEKTVSRKNLAGLVSSDFFKRNFHILFEDEEILVCNKPTGLVVHAGSKHQTHHTLIDLASCYLRQGVRKKKAFEPVLVHRLDKDTSGVILIAKNKQILRYLHTSIRKKEMKKNYRALCHGIPTKAKGTITFSLLKTHERNRGMKVKVDEQGLQAQSSYQVVQTARNISDLEIDLHTGRTHQIRVHLAQIGHPIIGDQRYGNNALDRQVLYQGKMTPRLYLHAEKISFFYPLLNKRVTFYAPLPKEFCSNF